MKSKILLSLALGLVGSSIATAAQKQKEAAPILTGRHRFGEDLTFFKLEHRFDATEDRVLDRGEGCGGEGTVDRFKEEGVLAVLHARYNPLSGRSGRIDRVFVLVLILRPVTRYGIDAESEYFLVGPPT